VISCLLLPRGVPAVFTQVDLQPPETVWTWLFYDFGLAPLADIEVDLTNDLPANNTYVMMLTHAQWIAWNDLDPFTLLTPAGQPSGVLNSHLISYWRRDFFSSATGRFKVEAPRKDRYHLGILNAQKHSMRLTGTLSLVNPGGQQLPLQQVRVPEVLLLTSTIFLLSGACYGVLMLTTWRKPTAMHLVILAAVNLKGLVLLLQWADRSQVARTGSNSVLSDISWQLLDKVQTIVELMMFLLIALGWKFLRATLNITEIRVAVGISVVSFYLGVFEVACNTASTCNGYQLSRYILHSLCYLVVIVAMNFNLQMVHAQIADAPASLEAGKLYRKRRSYHIFRWIFLAFIIAPTVELFLTVSVLPWDAVWVTLLLQQARTWVIYTCVTVAFRPDPPPLRVFELTVRTGDSDDEEPPGDQE